MTDMEYREEDLGAYLGQGSPEEIESAIALCELCDEEEQGGGQARDMLVVTLFDLFEKGSSRRHLDCAIDLAKELYELGVTTGHEDRRTRRASNYAKALGHRYWLDGDPEDLHESIRLSEEAVNASPHARFILDRPMGTILHNPTIEIHALNTLAAGLEDRFQLTGSLSDLNRSIDIRERLIAAVPWEEWQTSRAEWRLNLAASLQRRYEQAEGDSRSDIDRAVNLSEEVLRYSSEKSLSTTPALCTLAHALGGRAGVTQQVNDLDRAIQLLREAQRNTPANHADSLEIGVNLAMRLFQRYHISDSETTTDLDGVMGVAGTNGEGESCEYTQTVYSEATTADPANSRAYVSELCLDIHDKIRRETSLAPLPELFGTLPRLIKALAIKIGQESDIQVNRDIMYFLHKSHREISGLLKQLFLHGDEPDIKAPDQGAEHMSIQEKMALWATMEDTEVNKGELFEGVREEDEPENDITAKVELASYHRVIRSSFAYRWFLASVYRELRLQRKHTMTETISSKILGYLPPEKISKSRVPQTHYVTFELRFPLVPQQDTKLAEMIAVTGLPDEAQVTTVEEYIGYMWPRDGLRLLTGLQMVVDSSRAGTLADRMSVFRITLQDKTNIAVGLISGKVLVTVEGSACSIAEYGDQLAWLVTALSRRSDEGAVPHIPCCVKMDTPQLDLFRHPSGITTLSFLLLAGSSLPSEPWPCEKYWARSLIRTTPGTVFGYPTIRRPEACSGVEFSCHVLFRMFGHPSTDPSISGVRLASSGVTLQLVHRARDVFYWHECDYFTGPRSCSLHPGNHHLAGLTMEHVSHSQFSTGRHIICDCYEVPIGTDRGGTFPVSCLFPLSTDQIQDVNNALASASSTSSTSECFESDALSVSSDSEKAGFVDKESRAFQVFKRVFSRLVLLCQQETGQEQHPNTGKKTQQIQSGPDHASYTVGGMRSSNGRKRLLPRDNEDGDESGKPPPKKGKGRQPACQARSRFLACPFWKLDPEKHWECFLKKNDTIGHLKQHLSRRHIPKFYCPRCYTIFTDHASYDTHVVGASCTRGPTAKLQGISHMQRDELSRKSKGSIQEQWYALWTILFPEHDPPTSIYIESTQSEDFCRIREFCQRDGVTILRDELESSGFFLRPEVSEEALRVAVQRAMESMFDTYWLRRSSAQAGTHVSNSSGENRSSSAGRLPQPETAVGSSTDSGVDILPISRPSRNRPGGIAASSTVHSDGPGELRYTGDDWLRDGMGFPTDQPGLSGGFGGTQLHTRNGLDPSLAASDPAFSDMQFPFGHVSLQHGMNGLETEPDVGNSQEWAGHPTAGPSAIGSIQDGSQGRLNQTHGFFSEMGGPLEHLDYEYLLRDVVDGWRGDSIDEEERR